MRIHDIVLLALKAISSHHLRTLLTILGVAIGVSAVILLTALGDGARRYVIGEFTSLGTNLVTILPGRNETTGGMPPLMGETPRDLTIDDAIALTRSHNIRSVAPVMIGSAPVSWKGLEREVNIVGTTTAMKDIRQFEMAQGRFLPASDSHLSTPVCVLGEDLRMELFGLNTALGEWLRIGDRRFRVIGVIAKSGVSIGLDMDDMAMIPVASAQTLFNSPSLFRIILEAKTHTDLEITGQDIKRIISARHEGEDDITIITQDSVVSTFDDILAALTMGVAGIAAISLGVAGILIMNIMLVSVSQRTEEIGLLKALGANQQQIRVLFITEAILLSLFGALLGLLLGMSTAETIHRLYPVVPVTAPTWAIISSMGIAVTTGLLFGVLPAVRAARLDPVIALSRR